MKKTINKIISVLLFLSVLFTSFPHLVFQVSSAEIEEQKVGATSGTTGDCTWILDNDGTLTISGNGAMDDYNPWDNISAPWGISIKKVVIEYGVTSIGDDAFVGCSSLKSITIPDSVTNIGSGAFKDCINLTSVTIPDGVTSIYEDAFLNCTSLTSITIPDSVTSMCWGVFDNTAWYNNQPNGLTYIGKVAYKYKGKMPEDTSIVIKEGTISITDHAFVGCHGLTSPRPRAC